MKDEATASLLDVEESTPDPQELLEELFEKVARELTAQQDKWGTQDHPSIPRAPFVPHMILSIPSELKAKMQVENAVKNNQLTWGHIFVEELAEAVGAETVEHMEEELIQCLAVMVNWIFTNRRFASINDRSSK